MWVTGNKNHPPTPKHTHINPVQPKLFNYVVPVTEGHLVITLKKERGKKTSEYSWMPKIKSDQIKELNAVKQL